MIVKLRVEQEVAAADLYAAKQQISIRDAKRDDIAAELAAVQQQIAQLTDSCAVRMMQPSQIKTLRLSSPRALAFPGKILHVNELLS